MFAYIEEEPRYVPETHRKDDLEDNMPRYPENNLWASIAATLVEDYMRLLKEGQLTGFTAATRYELKKLRNEVCGEYFAYICDHCDINPYHIKKRLDQLDEQYGLHLS